MKKPLTYLIVLCFLFLFSGSVFGDDLIDGLNAYTRQDYKEAVKLLRLSAERGNTLAQYNLGVMHDNGKGVPQDYVLAYKWWIIAGSNGDKDAVKNRNIIEKSMSKQQIEKAQELARNWKPTTK